MKGAASPLFLSGKRVNPQGYASVFPALLPLLFLASCAAASSSLLESPGIENVPPTTAAPEVPEVLNQTAENDEPSLPSSRPPSLRGNLPVDSLVNPLVFLPGDGAGSLFLDPSKTIARLDGPVELEVRQGGGLEETPVALVLRGDDGIVSFPLRVLPAPRAGAVNARERRYRVTINAGEIPDPAWEDAISLGQPEVGVFYALMVLEDGESADELFSLSGQLLRVEEYTSGEQLALVASPVMHSSVDGPRWQPVLGTAGYRYEIIPRGSAGDIIASGVFRGHHMDDIFLRRVLPAPGNYRIRLRPETSAGRTDIAWSDWLDIRIPDRVLALDSRELVVQDLSPGASQAEQQLSSAIIPVDERNRSGITIAAYRLPAFMRYEMTNDMAAFLLNRGLEEQELATGMGEFGQPELYSLPNNQTVIGFEDLFYGIQFGLALEDQGDDPPRVRPVRGYENHPVTGITWFGALYLANRLSREHGRQPVYNLETLDWDYEKNGYRLPLEMEWEAYARLQRNTAPVNYFRSFDSWEDVRYPHTALGGPSAPGTAWEEFYRTAEQEARHLLGNMWEWCWDWYDERAYSSYALEDQTGMDRIIGQLGGEARQLLLSKGEELEGDPDPNDPIFLRVTRGAAWNSNAELVRLTNRGRFYVDETSWSVGLRLVLDREF